MTGICATMSPVSLFIATTRTVEEERVVAFSTLHQPVHRVLHVLLRRYLTLVRGLVRQETDVLRFETVLLCRTL